MVSVYVNKRKELIVTITIVTIVTIVTLNMIINVKPVQHYY